MDAITLLANVVSLLGVASNFYAAFKKDAKSFLLFQNLAFVMFAFSELIVGAYVGAAITIIGIVKNIFVSKDKFSTPIAVSFIIVFILTGIITWQNVWSLLPTLAAVIYILFTLLGKKIIFIKTGSAISSLLWAVYDIVNGLYFMCICDALTAVITIIKTYGNKKNKVKKEVLL